jgi:hypothetical protein
MEAEPIVPPLRELQEALRAGIIRREDNAAAMYVVGDGLAPHERLDIYRNTFASTLTNALRLSYPAVRRLVGPEFFDGAAQNFIQHRPTERIWMAMARSFPNSWRASGQRLR